MSPLNHSISARATQHLLNCLTLKTGVSHTRLVFKSRDGTVDQNREQCWVLATLIGMSAFVVQRRAGKGHEWHDVRIVLRTWSQLDRAAIVPCNSMSICSFRVHRMCSRGDHTVLHLTQEQHSSVTSKS